MKAKIKVNYDDIKKGQVFNILEIKGKRVSILHNEKIIDFGFSEVEIITQSNSDLFQLGKYIIYQFNLGFLMRSNDIKKSIKNVQLPIKKTLIEKSINHFIYS